MSRFYSTNLPPDLRVVKEEIEAYAREYGLDFYETIFEVVDADDLNEIAAYGGFPTRYPHWSFGMSYEELRKGYDYGLSKIYEMVINNDPCYAYLMRCNHLVDQKLVMAHVYGHCDFFKNNAYFAHTSRKMMDEMANHGSRIRRYVEKYGEDEVETFLDRCMSIDDLIDIHSTAIKRRGDYSRYDFSEKTDEDEIKSTRFKSKDYMSDYINPPGILKAEEEEARKRLDQVARSFPEQPEKDVLLFLIDHAPLKPWQRDIVSIVRDEAYYFMPQAQTKIMNEGWACLVAGSLVLTDRGLRPIDRLVSEPMSERVSDGEKVQEIMDRQRFSARPTIRISTRRGLVVEGSSTHRVQMSDGTWMRLDDIRVGNSVAIAAGTNIWPQEHIALNWQPKTRLTLQEIADTVGCDIETVIRYRDRHRSRHAVRLAPLVDEYRRGVATLGLRNKSRNSVTVPQIVDDSLAAFLGYLTGDGHISALKRTIGLTTADEEQAEHFSDLTEQLFGIGPRRKWDDGRWRVGFSSRDVQEFLVHLGMETGVAARRKSVPDVILRSPKQTVSAFLRALYDCDGYAGPHGVILVTSSDRLSEVVQLLLLNFGILSRRRKKKDGCWHVHTTGRSAALFHHEIGFRLQRKQERLREYVAERRWYKKENGHDEIVSIAAGSAPVFDLTVADTHRYVAQGMINHNSYWHSTMMTQKVLQPSEIVDYADHHSGTMAMHGARINPYKLGIELLRDIEHRWNTGRFGPEYDDCDNLDERRSWDRKLGLGRQKIFEVRRVHNDITFIDTYLTPEFCEEHKLFSYAFVDQTGQYVIESRKFDQIKKRLLFSLTNFGKPWIYVKDGNFRNRGELLLWHSHNGIDLKLDHARDTLSNLQFIWSRPVHLETIMEGKPTLLSFDGNEHSAKAIGETDANRTAVAKAR